MDTEANLIVKALRDLLKNKERLLRSSLNDGVVLQRDDPDYLKCFAQANELIAGYQGELDIEKLRRILGHIRQFNPFNSSDVEDNELLTEVVEDFIDFSNDRIDRLVK